MLEHIRQYICGDGNLQASRDINIIALLGDPTFPADLDQATARTLDSMKATRRRLTRVDEILYLLFLLFLTGAMLAYGGAFLGRWGYSLLGVAAIAGASALAIRQIQTRALIKLDLRAHQDVLAELFRRKLLSRIGGE